MNNYNGKATGHNHIHALIWRTRAHTHTRLINVYLIKTHQAIFVQFSILVCTCAIYMYICMKDNEKEKITTP